MLVVCYSGVQYQVLPGYKIPVHQVWFKSHKLRMSAVAVVDYLMKESGGQENAEPTKLLQRIDTLTRSHKHRQKKAKGKGPSPSRYRHSLSRQGIWASSGHPKPKYHPSGHQDFLHI